MNRTLIALLHTASLVLLPIIFYPIMCWYIRQYVPNTTQGMWFIVTETFVWIVLFVITIFRWSEALTQKDFKDIKY